MRLGGAIGAALVALTLIAFAGIVRFDASSGPQTEPVGTQAPPTTTSASATPTTTTTTTIPSPERVSMAFTGDLLPHTSVIEQARVNGAAVGAEYDFGPMFDDVRSLLSSVDLAVCHLEVPLSTDNSHIASYPSFSSPRELGAAIGEAGYDACSTASNHTIDQGPEGAAATLDVLDEAGVLHAGSARSHQEAAQPDLYTTPDGLIVGHVSGSYGYNGYIPDTPWRVGDLDAQSLIDAGRRARGAGADLVVASLHWGVEYQHDPTDDQLALAEQLTSSGSFDLIVGHHAHVVQPVRRFHGVPVLFGLGNFLSNMTDPTERDGVVAVVEAVRGGEARAWRFDVSLVPTWVDPSSFTIRPAVASLSRPDLDHLHGELRSSWERTIAVMTEPGIARARSAPSPAG